MMYYGEQDIAVADLGHEIYHKKEVELTKETAQKVKEYIEQGFKAIVKRTLMPMLDSIK